MMEARNFHAQFGEKEILELRYLRGLIVRYLAIKKMPIEKQLRELRSWEKQLPDLILK